MSEPKVQTNQRREGNEPKVKRDERDEGLFLSLIRSRLVHQSKSAIARELGVCPISVERWITGKRRPTRTVVLLAGLLWGGVAEMPAGLPMAGKPQQR
jgi:hypothetical protein